MESTKRSDKDMFEEFGLEVAMGDVEVGRTYPIFGMITKLICDKPGEVVAEINYNITAKMNIPDKDRINVIKERAFESGIFISTVTSKEPSIEVDCQTIIYGRSQAFHA